MTSSVACESVISPRVLTSSRSTPARTRAWLAGAPPVLRRFDRAPRNARRRGTRARAVRAARRGRASRNDRPRLPRRHPRTSREPIITPTTHRRPPSRGFGSRARARRGWRAPRTRARTSWPTARDPTSRSTSGASRVLSPAPDRRTTRRAPRRVHVPRALPASTDESATLRCLSPAPRPDPPPPLPHRPRRRRPHHLHGTTRPGVRTVYPQVSRTPPRRARRRPHVPRARHTRSSSPLPHAPPPFFFSSQGAQRPMRLCRPSRRSRAPARTPRSSTARGAARAWRTRAARRACDAACATR